ncbi:MAG: SDR family oxidoreductase [Anaerolineae bacterium]|nr:SDR family oxidoreductase [Anaerolineae bacterium]
MNNPILVTGASGNVGREVVQNLLAMGQVVRATAVDAQDAQYIPGGAEIVLFDYADPATYHAAFDGVEKVFLLRPPAISDVAHTIKPAVTYAVAAGVKHIVFLSLIGAENNHFVPHYKIEKMLETVGMAYTFLRAGFFMQNLNTTHRADIVKENDIFIPAGQGRTAFIDTRDIGAVAAKVLTEPGHENTAYALTGHETLTYGEVADIFSQVLGREIQYSNPSLPNFAWRMRQRGYPWSYIGVMSGIYLTTRLGLAEKVTGDTAVLLARPPISMRQYVQDYASVWQEHKK